MASAAATTAAAMTVATTAAGIETAILLGAVRDVDALHAAQVARVAMHDTLDGAFCVLADELGHVLLDLVLDKLFGDLFAVAAVATAAVMAVATMAVVRVAVELGVADVRHGLHLAHQLRLGAPLARLGTTRDPVASADAQARRRAIDPDGLGAGGSDGAAPGRGRYGDAESDPAAAAPVVKPSVRPVVGFGEPGTHHHRQARPGFARG